MRKPDFIIGGVSRSGTSSLYRWLADHPAVGMSSTKEVRFFDVHYEEGMRWYSDHFPEHGVCGEASPRYLATPEVAGRIAMHLPDVKLIFSLREPVSRAYSDYWMTRHRGRGPDQFDDALTHEPWRSLFIDAGHYAEHLARFYSLFPADNILVVTFEEVSDHPHATMEKICRLINVDGGKFPQSVGSRVNASVSFRSLRLRTMSRSWPRPLRDAVGKLNARPSVNPPMNPATQQRLREHYAPHNEELARLLPSLNLSGWYDTSQRPICPK